MIRHECQGNTWHPCLTKEFARRTLHKASAEWSQILPWSRILPQWLCQRWSLPVSSWFARTFSARDQQVLVLRSSFSHSYRQQLLQTRPELERVTFKSLAATAATQHQVLSILLGGFDSSAPIHTACVLKCFHVPIAREDCPERDPWLSLNSLTLFVPIPKWSKVRELSSFKVCVGKI